jgi:solute carrier family 35, member E3
MQLLAQRLSLLQHTMADQRMSLECAAMASDGESSLSRSSHDEGASLVSRDDEPPQYQDVEKAIEAAPKPKDQKERQFLIWTVVNTLATIGIVSQLLIRSSILTFQVFTNKAIFQDASLRRNQSTFAAFHFTVTAATLWYASRPGLGMFVPQRAPFVGMLPLGLAMCLNVILPNLSLAFSSVAFYQLARVLLTPLTAVINFAFYGAKMPRQAVYCLVPICLGVGIMSYFDTKGGQGRKAHTAHTSPLGVIFALSGVLASSLYTVWIGTYHKKFNMNSMQLLFNQAPISAFLLLYVIPFTDEAPQWGRLGPEKYFLILFVSLRPH